MELAPDQTVALFPSAARVMNRSFMSPAILEYRRKKSSDTTHTTHSHVLATTGDMGTHTPQRAKD